MSVFDMSNLQPCEQPTVSAPAIMYYTCLGSFLVDSRALHFHLAINTHSDADYLRRLAESAGDTDISPFW